MKKATVILNASEYPKSEIKKLKKKRHILIFKPKNKIDLLKSIKKYSKKYEIVDIFLKLGIFYDNDVLSASNFKLKTFVTPTTGLSHIDDSIIKEKKIKILYLENKKVLNKVSSTAEHAWAMLLALNKNLYMYNDRVISDKSWERKECVNYEVKDKSLGIIGFGRLGKIIYKYARAFGMKILIYDKKKINIKGAKQSSLKIIFKKSDFISLNLSLNEKTKKIIDIDLLRLSKKNLIFINTARGEIVDQKELFKLLKKNRIFGLGLDVLENDSVWSKKIPKNTYELLKRNKNKIIVTPHIGGYSFDAIKKTRIHIMQKYINYIK